MQHSISNPAQTPSPDAPPAQHEQYFQLKPRALCIVSCSGPTIGEVGMGYPFTSMLIILCFTVHYGCFLDVYAVWYFRLKFLRSFSLLFLDLSLRFILQSPW
jgi:hypothetical protein